MQLYNIITIMFMLYFGSCKGQDTIISIDRIIEIEQEIIDEQKTAEILFSSGLTLSIIAFSQIYKKSNTFVVYIVMGSFLETMGIIHYIEARRKENEINEIYNNIYSNEP